MIKFNHFNFNVLDLERSIAFYKEALGLEIVREKKKEDFTLVYLGEKYPNIIVGDFTYIADAEFESHGSKAIQSSAMMCG